MTWEQIIITAIQWGVPLILAITLHEAGHAYAAKILGDSTADDQGRVSLNPLKHIDPVGTILLPAILFFIKAPFLFGYAKPVPVAYNKLNHLPRDIAIVAAAGPAANVILIILSALLFNVGAFLPLSWQQPFAQMISISIIVNTVLAVFNLIPIPPLDGSKILMTFSPRPVAIAIMKLERYGIFLVMGILLLMPYISELLGYNPLSLLINSVLTTVVEIVEPLMKLHCFGIQSEACGNL